MCANGLPSSSLVEAWTQQPPTARGARRSLYVSSIAAPAHATQGIRPNAILKRCSIPLAGTGLEVRQAASECG